MTLSKTLNELKALVLCGAVILFAQWVNTVRGGTTMEFLTAVVGMFIIILIYKSEKITMFSIGIELVSCTVLWIKFKGFTFIYKY